MEEFVREKIKDKPINKRKIAIKILVAAVCGAVFAITACLVAAFLWPKINPQNENNTVVDNQQKETETQTSTESTETSSEEASPNDTEATLDYELTVQDYQHIQNELYHIGSTANKSIVTITSVQSDTDWFNNSYEIEGQGAGAIIADENLSLIHI